MSDTIIAALIEVAGLIFTGLCALYAGRKVYKAATRDTTHKQSTVKKRELTYNRRMLIIVNHLTSRIAFIRNACSDKPEIYKNFPIDLPEEMNPIYWENHALLGAREIELIFSIWSGIMKYDESLAIENSGVLGKMITVKSKGPYEKPEQAIDKLYKLSQELETLLKQSLIQKQSEKES